MADEKRITAQSEDFDRWYTDVVRRADWIVDVGPGAGELGGAVLYSGQTQLLTPAGVLPLAFDIEASTLKEAIEQFPGAVKEALEQAIDEAREMRREAATRIVVPDVGAGAPVGGGKIKF